MILTKVCTIHGRVMMTRADAAKELNVSPQTIDNRCREIKEEIKAGRYPEMSIIEDGGIKLINFLVLIDYMHNRKRLKEKNLRKHVPPFDAKETAKGLGYYAEQEAV